MENVLHEKQSREIIGAPMTVLNELKPGLLWQHSLVLSVQSVQSVVRQFVRIGERGPERLLAKEKGGDAFHSISALSVSGASRRLLHLNGLGGAFVHTLTTVNALVGNDCLAIDHRNGLNRAHVDTGFTTGALVSINLSGH